MELDRSIVEGVNKANKKLGEFFYLLANEPSVGLYHVQEHIRKTIPKNSELKREIRKKYQNIEALTYDVNFSIQTVKSLHDLNTFSSIKQTMDACTNMLNSMNKGQAVKRVGPATPSRPGAPYGSFSSFSSFNNIPPSPLPSSATIPEYDASGTATERQEYPAVTPATPTSSSTLPPPSSAPPPPSPSPSPAQSAPASVPAPFSSPSQSLSSSSSFSSLNTTAVETAQQENENENTNTEISGEADNTTEQAEPGDLGEVGVTPRKVKKSKKPKAAKNLSKNFDLTPKQF